MKNWLYNRLTPNPEKEAAKIRDDEAVWTRVPTKIDMDAMLSADLNAKKEPHGSKNTPKEGK